MAAVIWELDENSEKAYRVYKRAQNSSRLAFSISSNCLDLLFEQGKVDEAEKFLKRGTKYTEIRYSEFANAAELYYEHN